MVGPRVYHLKHARSYPAFTAQDPAKVMDLAVQWLKRHDFRVKRKNKTYSRGSKKGIHVNFVPKYKLYIEQGTNGNFVVRFDYYAKIKLGTAVVVGVLTSGISTVVGVGTLAITLADADHFVDKFWAYLDSLARGAPVILTMERWASDGKGGFVKTPLPPGSAVPVGVVPAHTVPGAPVHPQPFYTPAHTTAPPPPQPIVNRNRSQSEPLQPGQVYGHVHSNMGLQSTALPPPPQYYPHMTAAGHPPPPPAHDHRYPPYNPAHQQQQNQQPPQNQPPYHSQLQSSSYPNQPTYLQQSSAQPYQQQSYSQQPSYSQPPSHSQQPYSQQPAQPYPQQPAQPLSHSQQPALYPTISKEGSNPQLSYSQSYNDGNVNRQSYSDSNDNNLSYSQSYPDSQGNRLSYADSQGNRESYYEKTSSQGAPNQYTEFRESQTVKKSSASVVPAM